jgi:hypothetical protein
LGGLIPEPELRDTVGQSGISDIEPNLVQPRPDVFQAVAGRQQVFDFRPCLADLPYFGAWLLRHTVAQTT